MNDSQATHYTMDIFMKENLILWKIKNENHTMDFDFLT